MKIQKIDRSRMRNDEHFQFNSEFLDLIRKHGAQNLKIETLFSAYQPAYVKEDEGIKRVSKSVFTARIHEADKARDDVYSGMAEIAAASLKHYTPAVREAAQTLKILFDTYGDISRKPLNEQTSAVYNILQELRGDYREAAQTVGITGWADELETRNNAFEALVKVRFDEAAAKTDVVVKAARAELDAVYDAIVERINAFVVIEGAAAYEQFVRTLNSVIAKYTAILNARLGRKGRKAGDVEDEEPEEQEPEEV
jgi:hypothetical protein